MNQQPAPAAPPEELNPFDIALRQFDIAADHLSPDESMRQVLKHLKSQIGLNSSFIIPHSSFLNFSGERRT